MNDENEKRRKKTNNYFADRSLDSDSKTDRLLEELPDFCSEFIYGTSNNTSPLTRLNYAYDLRIFFDYVSRIKNIEIEDMDVSVLDSLKSFDIERFLVEISHYNFRGKDLKCNEKGKARKLSTIRAMYRYFYNRDVIGNNVASKVATPKIHEKEIIRLEGEESRKLLEFAESDSPFGSAGKKNAFHNKLKTRDYAIISLFLGTGIRISELIGLNTDDFDFEQNSFVVTRKGGNRTTLYFNDDVKSALLAWIDERSENKAVDANNKALFISMKNQRISTRAVQILVKSYASQVTPLKKITPHKLRSTFGTNLYQQTGDIYAVSDFLGHKDVNTTRKHYAAITEDSRRHSAAVINIKGEGNE